MRKDVSGKLVLKWVSRWSLMMMLYRDSRPRCQVDPVIASCLPLERTNFCLRPSCPTTDRPKCQVVPVIASCLPHERATLLDFKSVWQQSGLELIKLFSCSTQLGMKFILLKNVKMPTIVGILTFLSRIHTTSSCLRAGKMPHFFTFYLLSSWHFMLNLVEQEKIIYPWGLMRVPIFALLEAELSNNSQLFKSWNSLSDIKLVQQQSSVLIMVKPWEEWHWSDCMLSY